jgi:hypothetical protein
MAVEAAEEVADAQVVGESAPPPSRELVRHDAAPATVAPQVEAEELGKRLATIKQAMEEQMVRDVDYGVVPGTGGKPTLLKPGAEKLSVLFQLDVQLVNEKVWDGPHLTVISHGTAYHAPTGTRLGYGEGICSTREKKYAYRNAQRNCPECGQPAVRVGRNRETNQPENYYCWNKPERGSHGCGARFQLGDPRIESQEVGQIENPDLPDAWNTVVKMAEKRARVDAVLAVTGASALFTQDAEDRQSTEPPAAPAADVPPFGPPIPRELFSKLGAAAKRIAGGSSEGGKALWKEIQEQCGGYGPQAAALAVISCAEKLEALPWDPKYEPGRHGDVPSEQQVMAEAKAPTEVSEEMVAGLGDEVLSAWIAAGVSEREAMNLVQGILRKRTLVARWNSLQQSLTQAQETKARKEAIQ